MSLAALPPHQRPTLYAASARPRSSKNEILPMTIIAPLHLSPAARSWFAHVVTDFELEPHHVHLLKLACESYDRAEQARLAVAVHGITYLDRFGSPKPRPEVAIERDSRIGFARLLRELDLDRDGGPEAPRAPAIPSNRRS